MPDSATGGYGARNKDPNFMKVVIASVIVVLLFFIGAWLVVMHSGRHLLPQKHHDNHPHSLLVIPNHGRRTA